MKFNKLNTILKTNRDSKYELVRIIAAIFITFNHVPCSDASLPFNSLVRSFFFLGGQFGVNIFVIVGCWFLVDGKFKTERINRIIWEMLFYSILLNIVSFTILGVDFSIKKFIKGFSYWYPFGYVTLLFLMPILQKLSLKIQKTISIFGIAIFGFVTILGSIAPYHPIVYLFSKGVFIGPVWFSYVFIIISFLKKSKYNKFFSYNSKIFFVIFIFNYILMYIVCIFTKRTYIREVCSPICFLSALSMFLVIVNTKITKNNIINLISSSTFAVYLIQSHMNFRDFLWNILFKFDYWSCNTYFYGWYALLATIFIFILAIIIEQFRNKFFKLNFIKNAIFWTNKLGSRIINLIYQYFGMKNI